MEVEVDVGEVEVEVDVVVEGEPYQFEPVEVDLTNHASQNFLDVLRIFGCMEQHRAPVPRMISLLYSMVDLALSSKRHCRHELWQRGSIQLSLQPCSEA